MVEGPNAYFDRHELLRCRRPDRQHAHALRGVRLDKLIKPNDNVAIKLHCGDWNNMGYLRPAFARPLAGRIKEAGDGLRCPLGE